MNRIVPLAFVVLLSFIAACNDDEGSGTPSGLIYSYFPTNVGHEVIYDVSLITKDEFSGLSDTSYYQVKEVIESEFIDNEGRPTQRLERYRRDTPSDPWTISDVWTSNRTNQKVEKKEENFTFVKMVFPITPYVTWDGNSLNTLDEQEYQYEDLHVPAVIGGINFDSTLTVLQSEFKDLFDTIDQVEKYAPGIGLIYKKDIQVQTNFPAPGILSQRRYTETCVSWAN